MYSLTFATNNNHKWNLRTLSSGTVNGKAHIANLIIETTAAGG